MSTANCFRRAQLNCAPPAPMSQDARFRTAALRAVSHRRYTGRRMQVLIAEDDRVTGEILARTLQRWNYQTTVVGDGSQAWEHLRATDAPTLAILHWMM